MPNAPCHEPTLFDHLIEPEPEPEETPPRRWSCGPEIHPGRPSFAGYFKAGEFPATTSGEQDGTN